MKIKLTEEAQDDFKNMFAYYYEETQDAEYTLRIIRDIRGKIEDLQVFPFRCPPLNYEDETIRALNYKNYSIQYFVDEKDVVILNVKHAKRRH